jgi:hypothetical protein
MGFIVFRGSESNFTQAIRTFGRKGIDNMKKNFKKQKKTLKTVVDETKGPKEVQVHLGKLHMI